MTTSRFTDSRLEGWRHVDTRPFYLTLGVLFVRSSTKSRTDILMLQVK